MGSNRLTTFIIVGLVLGIIAGYVCHRFFPQASTGFAAVTSLLPTAFLRLIKMIIAPLVFSTLVVGIGKMGDIATVGRVGVKALGWFIFASLISLTLGLILVGWLQPGKAMHLSIPAANASSGVEASGLTMEGFVTHLIPTSVIDSMARNEILQIVVFALFLRPKAWPAYRAPRWSSLPRPSRSSISPKPVCCYCSASITFSIWAAPPPT